MTSMGRYLRTGLLAVAISLLVSPTAIADVVTDWNIKLGDIVTDARLPTPPSARILAIVHTAMYEAANAVTKRYPASGLNVQAAPGASVEAAIARNREVGGHRRRGAGSGGSPRIARRRSR